MKTVGFVCYQYQWEHFLKMHAQNTSNVKYIPIIVSYDLISRREASGLISEYIALFKLLNKNQYDLVITITPKLGLLVSLIKIFQNFKHIHWFTGQIWANKSGLGLLIYKYIDKVTFLLSDLTLCDSKSQKDFLIQSQVVTSDKCIVPHNGSICGFDEKLLDLQAPDLQKEILTFGIVGRICQEKGSLDVIKDLHELLVSGKIKLVYIGHMDDDEGFKSEFLNNISKFKNITCLGEITNQMELFNSFDVLIQPSYREGFSNVVLEAQAAARPVICRDIYGLKSTFKNGETGLEFSGTQLHSIITNLLNNKSVLAKYARNAQKFAIQNFSRSEVLSAINKIYLEHI